MLLWRHIYLSYFIIAFIPYSWFREQRRVNRVIEELKPLVEDDALSFPGWRDLGVRLSCTPRNWLMSICGATVCLLGTMTVQRLESLTIVKTLLWQPVFWICGCAAYGVSFFFWFEYSVARRRLRKQFLDSGKNAVRRLTELSYLMASLTVVEYVGLLVALPSCTTFDLKCIFQSLAVSGSTGTRSPTSVWMLALGVFPLFSMMLGTMHTHHLQKEIKVVRLRAFHEKKQELLPGIDSLTRSVPKSTDTQGHEVDVLKKLFEIEAEIDRTKEWPIDLQTILLFIVDMLTAIKEVLGILGKW